MTLTMRPYRNEDDFWRIRNFLREVFLLNDRHEQSWHVARFDYWRWHFVKNLNACPPLEQVIFIWETPTGRIGAVLHPFGMNEAFLAVHPDFRTTGLESKMIAIGEAKLTHPNANGDRHLFISAGAQDQLRQQVLAGRGFTRRDQMVHRWYRDLDTPIPDVPVAGGYQIRAMGSQEELPARSWASWTAFHPDEPDEAYDNDGGAWMLNLQAAPLYRRDLDIVAATPEGEIASFCTIYYDDYTRSAVCVLVGTAQGHQRHGLGKAVITGGLKRLKTMGCTRVFANAYDPPANALYRSALGTMAKSYSWIKRF